MNILLIGVGVGFLTIFVETAKPTAYKATRHDYHETPNLFEFEDFDSCMRDPKGTPRYCLVDVELLKKPESELLNKIRKQSTRVFRYDKLFLGVCWNRCLNYTHKFDKLMEKNYFTGRLEDKLVIVRNMDVYKRVFDRQLLAHKTINLCLNHEFTKRYGINLNSTVEYCVDEMSEKIENESIDYFFYCFIGIVGCLLIVSSVADYYLKQKVPPTEDEGSAPTPAARKISFSIIRSWEDLKSDRDNFFLFLETIRFVVMGAVVFANLLLIVTSLPVSNPSFVEKNLKIVHTIFVGNAYLIIQMFFVISGLLLYIKIKRMYKKSSMVSIFWKCVLGRYIRIMPSLLFFILFNAVALPRLNYNGPFWRHCTESDVVFCRNNWWINVLLINNFFINRSCLPHTSYLAADFQLYLIYIVVILLILRFPRMKLFLLVFIFTTSMIIPTIVSYELSLNGIYKRSLWNIRNGIFTSQTLQHLQLPFYTNLSGYLYGILLFELKENIVSVTRSFRVIWYLMIPAIISLLFIGLAINHTQPSFWISLYNGLIRQSIGLFYAILIFGFIMKSKSEILAIFEKEKYILLGKLTFQAYLGHPLIIKMLLGTIRQPIHLNASFLIGHFVAVMGLSYGAAVIVSLTIEKPFVMLFEDDHKVKKVEKNVTFEIEEHEIL